MDDFFRLKTPRSKPRKGHNSTPQRGDKRKPWERSDRKREQGE